MMRTSEPLNLKYTSRGKELLQSLCLDDMYGSLIRVSVEDTPSHRHKKLDQWLDLTRSFQQADEGPIKQNQEGPTLGSVLWGDGSRNLSKRKKINRAQLS